MSYDISSLSASCSKLSLLNFMQSATRIKGKLSVIFYQRRQISPWPDVVQSPLRDAEIICLDSTLDHFYSVQQNLISDKADLPRVSKILNIAHRHKLHWINRQSHCHSQSPEYDIGNNDYTQMIYTDDRY